MLDQRISQGPASLYLCFKKLLSFVFRNIYGFILVYSFRFLNFSFWKGMERNCLFNCRIDRNLIALNELFSGNSKLFFLALSSYHGVQK